MRRELLFPSCSYGRVRKSPEGSAVASCTLEPPGPHVRPNKISWSPLERSGPHHTTAHRHHPDPEPPRYIAAAASPSSLPTKALCGDGDESTTKREAEAPAARTKLPEASAPPPASGTTQSFRPHPSRPLFKVGCRSPRTRSTPWVFGLDSPLRVLAFSNHVTGFSCVFLGGYTSISGFCGRDSRGSRSGFGVLREF